MSNTRNELISRIDELFGRVQVGYDHRDALLDLIKIFADAIGGTEAAAPPAPDRGPTLAESVAAGVVKVLPDGTITGVSLVTPAT